MAIFLVSKRTYRRPVDEASRRIRLLKLQIDGIALVTGLVIMI
jgi:hypothetical protein